MSGSVLSPFLHIPTVHPSEPLAQGTVENVSWRTGRAEPAADTVGNVSPTALTVFNDILEKAWMQIQSNFVREALDCPS